jgi:hypothetical protein
MKTFMSLFTPLFTLVSASYAWYQVTTEPTGIMVFAAACITACIVPSINILKESK